METTSAHPARKERSFWVPVICGAVILTIGIGARQSFGIFQKPIALDLKVGRELWSFGNALSMLLMGVLSPFVGNVADRFGTARTVAARRRRLRRRHGDDRRSRPKASLLTLGNALTGIGMAAAGFGPIFGAITRQTPPEKRSIALGVATAGGSFGQFAVVPFASLLQERLGDWHTTMLVLALGLDRHDPADARPARGPRRRARATGRRAPAQTQPRGARRGLRQPQLLAPHLRLLRLRLPRRLRRPAPAGLHLRQGRRHDGARHHGVAARARRLGDRARRPVQHRRLADVGLARRPAQAQGHAGAALSPALARSSSCS